MTRLAAAVAPAFTAALGLVVAACGVITALSPPPEPAVQTWRPATVAEDRSWQARHLADVMSALRDHPTDPGEAHAGLDVAVAAVTRSPTGTTPAGGAGANVPG